MELDLRRPPRRRPRLLLIAALVLSGWLLVVALVPPLFGWHVAVVDESRDGYAQGTLLLTRAVPSSDLAGGDVVAVEGGVRRVSAVRPGVIQVEGAKSLLANEMPTLDRVVLTTPVAGLPLTGLDGLAQWLLLTGAVASLSAAAATHRGLGRARLAA